MGDQQRVVDAFGRDILPKERQLQEKQTYHHDQSSSVASTSQQRTTGPMYSRKQPEQQPPHESNFAPVHIRKFTRGFEPVYRQGDERATIAWKKAQQELSLVRAHKQNSRTSQQLIIQKEKEKALIDAVPSGSIQEEMLNLGLPITFRSTKQQQVEGNTQGYAKAIPQRKYNSYLKKARYHRSFGKSKTSNPN
mmetsp:Transcript_19292/g.28732  ORF Transcript_19292/g.28732 Transcript_19292/m.28732 type:complete len:193 (+) Transcript_19292:67-645(+)